MHALLRCQGHDQGRLCRHCKCINVQLAAWLHGCSCAQSLYGQSTEMRTCCSYEHEPGLDDLHNTAHQSLAARSLYMMPIAQSNPAPSGRRSAHAQTTGAPRAASSIDKSHESILFTAQGCARCPARRFWQPAQDPTRGSAELRSTRQLSPCPTLAVDLRDRAGWSGTDVEARPRSAPAMSRLSSDDSSRMQLLEVSSEMWRQTSRSRGVNS